MANNFTPSTFRPSTVTNLSYSTSAGAAVSTAGFGTQTYWISLTGTRCADLNRWRSLSDWKICHGID